MIASRHLLLPLALLLTVLATLTSAQAQRPQPAAPASGGQDTAAEGNRVFSYYYGQAHGLRPWEQPAEKLTHVIFSFFNILDDGTVTMQGPTHTAAGIESVAKSSKNMMGFLDQRPCNCQGQCLKGELWQTHLLKTRFPHLKTIMSIGGWTWSDNFSVAFSTAAGRRRAIETSQELMEQFGFDGVDIDFEFPGMAKSSKDPVANKFWTSSVNDWQNMAAFFTEARAAYGNKYSLSAALPGLPFGANTAWPTLGRTLDYALIMAYENNHMPTRAWGGGTLRSVDSDDSVEKMYNVKAGMDNYVSAGIPRNKLILGIPLYGTGFSGLNRNMRFRDNIPGFGVDIRANNLVKLEPTGYNKIMEQVKQGGWTKTVDERRGITVYFNGSTVWFVDTPETMRIKGEYAKQERLGGIMYWNANQDVLPSDPDSLMTAAVAAYPVDLNPPHKRTAPWCVQPDKTPWCNLHCGYVYPEGNNLTRAADTALSTTRSKTAAGGLADVNTGGFGAGRSDAGRPAAGSTGLAVAAFALLVSMAALV